VHFARKARRTDNVVLFCFKKIVDNLGIFDNEWLQESEGEPSINKRGKEGMVREGKEDARI